MELKWLFFIVKFRVIVWVPKIPSYRILDVTMLCDKCEKKVVGIRLR